MEEEFYIPTDEVTTSMKMIRFYFKRVGWIAPNYTAKLFWKLFTEPRKRTLSEHQKSFLAKGKVSNHHIQYKNASYNLYQFGEGPIQVLICHGWEGRTSDFEPLINKLLEKKELQILSIDFPGHGETSKQEAHLPMFIHVIQDVIHQSKNIQIFIGHSLGAAAIAMTVPENKLFFEGKKIVLMGLHPVPSQFFYQYKSVTKVSDKLFEKCVTYAESQVGVSLSEYDCYNYVSLYENSQILLIHDSEDRIIHLKRIEDLSDKIDSATLFHGIHGGHFRHYKHRDAIKKIMTFISE